MSAKEPYGSVRYADPGYQQDGVKRYPIDSIEHVRAALSYINHSGNESKYKRGDLAKVRAAIYAAARRYGIDAYENAAQAAFAK